MVAFASNNLTVYGVVNGGNAIRQWEFGESEVTRIKDWTNNLDGITGLIKPRFLAVFEDNLYVQAQSAILSFSIGLDGALTFLGSVEHSYGWFLVVSPDGAYVYDLGSSGFVRWQRDVTTGVLGSAEVITASNTSSGVSALAFSPDGAHLYGAIPSSGIAHWGLQGSTATFRELLSKTDNPGLTGVANLVVTPDATQVIATARDDFSLVVLDREADGALTSRQVFFDGYDGVDGLNYPAGLVVSPDGSSLYVAAAHDNTLGVFSRSESGEVAYVQAYPKDDERSKRSVSVSLTARGDIFKGRVTAEDGWDECEKRAEVIISRRRANGSWARLWYGYSKDDGTFRARIEGWPTGKFRAKAREQRFKGPLEVTCLEEVSAILVRK